MYGYEDYYDEQIYEPTPLDELFTEYRDKCKTILLASVQSEIDGIKNSNVKLKEENNNLHSEIRQLKNDTKLANEKCKNSILVDSILNNINKDNFTEFISIIYKKDYEEDWSIKNTPLWLGILTEYYSHKDKLIDMFKTFNIKVPNDINNFRLPVDWNENELDIFFDTLSNHYNCNGNTYKRNLQYWGSSSLKSVKDQCNRNYSEIPWQFVLRNPLLKQEKYLKLMGKKMVEKYSRHGTYFSRIYSYQTLTDNKIKIILNNINYIELKELKYDVGSFILRHVNLIENDIFLEKVYALIKEDYRAFDYIKKMPSEYIKRYLLENKKKALELLKDCENLSKEGKQEVIKIIVGV